jgi:hypothetical protein
MDDLTNIEEIYLDNMLESNEEKTNINLKEDIDIDNIHVFKETIVNHDTIDNEKKQKEELIKKYKSSDFSFFA